MTKTTKMKMPDDFPVWDHFTTLGTQVVACNYCQKVMGLNKSMMNLVRHFEQMHKNEPQSSMEENESLQWLLEVPENPLDEQMKDDDENEDKAVLENPYESTTNVVYHEISAQNSPPKTQSVEQSCRICLCDLVEINHVGFQDSLKNFDNVTYLEVFKECTGFDVGPLEPQHLCVNCALKLVEAYELRRQCMETQQVLDELLNSGETMNEEGEIVEEEEEEKPIKEEEFIIEEFVDEEESEEMILENYQDEIKSVEVTDYLNALAPVEEPKVYFEKTVFDENVESFQCNVCLAVYKSIRALRTHYKSIHAEMQNQKCKYCYIDCFPQLVDIHMAHCARRHSVVRPICPVCGKTASRNHVYRHIARSKMLDQTGRIIEKPYECDLCGARATTKNGIGIHIKSLHLNLKIQCSFCDVQVKSRSNLGTHMRRCHPDIKKPLSCDTCDFRTVSAASLVRHKAIHSGNKPHKCEVCGRFFVTKDALSVHFATHSEDRPHRCEVCDAAFKTRKTLGAHMRTHRAHEYECPVCRKSYLTNQQMRMHVTKNHPFVVLPPRGTIMNKKWHAKQSDLELKRELQRSAVTVMKFEELEESHKEANYQF